jgi:hypothetical protein
MIDLKTMWRPAALYFLFVLISLAVVLSWRSTNKHTLTGDEPRYLITASSLFHQHSLDQTVAMDEEIATRKIYHFGFKDRFDTGLMHTLHGYFSPHGLALSAYLAIPFGLGNAVGARLAIILLNATIVIYAWRFACTIFDSHVATTAAVLICCFAMPFLSGAGQFYPDLPVGTICLAALFCILCKRQPKIDLECHLVAIAVATLPWWHIKSIAPMAILVVAAIWSSTDRKAAAWAYVLPLTISLSLFVAYNEYTYQTIFGFSGPHPLEISRTSVMVVLGLLLDQNQGVLMQNPTLLAAFFAIPVLLSKDWRSASILVLLVLSVWIPNAMHPNWYGGFSFSGRFQWTMAAVLIPPALSGLAYLHRRSSHAFAAMCGALGMVQIYYFSIYALSTTELYNRAPTPTLQYSIFAPFAPFLLPRLDNIATAPHLWANYIFATILIVTMIFGLVINLRRSLHRSMRAIRPSVINDIQRACLPLGSAAARHHDDF